MPSIALIIASFLTGSILTLVVPLGVLIAVAICAGIVSAGCVAADVPPIKANNNGFQRRRYGAGRQASHAPGGSSSPDGARC